MSTKRLALLVIAALAGCAVNPVTGHRELSLVSESQEIQVGQQGAADVRRSVGVYQDSALGAYLTSLGTRIVSHSERPNLPWSFQIADEPVVNAFALPGGPVFIARGILPYFNNEAELIAVLGHEIGHVTARHSAKQMTREQLAGIGLGVAAIGASMVNSDLTKYLGAAQSGLGILMLKYSRDNESQADALGFRYGLNGGWDMRKGTDMFNTLSRVSGPPSSRLPEWQSTHPAPEGRAEANQQRVDAAIARGVDFDTLRVERESYLRRIEGLVYGDDPREGYFVGTTFYHPTLKLEIAFPSGWRTQNGKDQVSAGAPDQSAVMAFAAAGTESPATYADRFAAQQGIAAARSQSLSLNGLPAVSVAFQAPTSQGTVEGRETFIAIDGTTYQLLGYGPVGMQGNDAKFLAVARSVARLTDPGRINVQPKRVHIVRLASAQTIVAAGRANGNAIPDAELASINEVAVDQVIPAGTVVKVVK